MSKQKEIIKIAQDAGTEKVEIWTADFVATGTLYTEKTADSLVTLTNVGICPLFCDCSESKVTRDWLNIEEDAIIAFTALK